MRGVQQPAASLETKPKIIYLCSFPHNPAPSYGSIKRNSKRCYPSRKIDSSGKVVTQVQWAEKSEKRRREREKDKPPTHQIS